MREWVLGDPLDPETRMGAIIESAHMEKILSNIETAKNEGATVRCGGNQTRTESGGWFVEPTILTDVTPGMTVARDEVFGPVLSVSTFTHADEGIAMANDTDYGLHASVFTANVRSAHLASRMLKAGTVSINCYSEGDMTTPFGGYGLSGFGGRDNGVQAHEQYTEAKTIWIDLS